MTTEQITKAVAELDGYKQSRFGTEDAPVWYTTDDDGMIYDLPPYTTSRDAIVPVIEKQGREIGCEIINNLAHMLDIDSDWSEQGASLAILCATPLQFCEALLRATKKWKD